ncbi:hypothetical protein [Methanothermococcus okinawensis]|uniref:Uncharacterized protein n=1 Tax=Methanothermococcus okinawensis (strain DSM 14208 / JCM 11175 / IH1) TaxID=647113 RepID=F8AL15_METOI|nr:hypothetical protein [Methanothermococcus okinawensis]AEH06450.1 hypothetical protein Metok_0468 [Methanothermococcus okinawensis IH1]
MKINNQYIYHILFPEYYLYLMGEKQTGRIREALFSMSFLWIFVKIYLILGFIVSIVYRVDFFTSSVFLMIFVMLIITFSIIAKYKKSKKKRGSNN